MRLRELLRGVAALTPEQDVEITGVCSNSQKAEPGDVFVCLPGRSHRDYSAYLAQAARLGAVAAVTQQTIECGEDLLQIVVADARAALAVMSANFFGNPAQRLRLIGVTGTNGKTSTAYLTRQILEAAGHPTGLIGTVETIVGGEHTAASLTTPEPVELHALFARMAQAGMEYVVMECSSQALEQRRLEGLDFEVGVFTNLTQDHLDYHGTMANYQAAKSRLFTHSRVALLNADDPASAAMAAAAKGQVRFYSAAGRSADFTAGDIAYRPDSVEYALAAPQTPPVRVRVPIPGNFTVYNSLAALSAAVLAGVPTETAAQVLARAVPVRGRAEVAYRDERMTVLIDYAHTPDAICNILQAVPNPQGRRVVLFGCGGDRDRGKRPLMAQAAAKYADFLIVTSDNPRSEDPNRILEDVLAGLRDCATPYVAIVDRREAIRYAMEHAQPGDVIFLLGKGHEDYQILATGKVHLDEREVVREVAQAIRA